MSSDRRLRVLVTGASSGIGETIATALAGRGLTVFGTSRTPRMDGASGFQMLPLDVRSDESVRECLAAIVSEAGGVDVLVNNAGYALTSAAEETSIDEAKEQFDTNFFGVVRVTNAVLPLMRQVGAGKVIMMGSLAGTLGVPFWSYYCATKFALEGYCEALWYEVRPFGISVSIVEPGWVRTSLGHSGSAAAVPLPAYATFEQRASEAIHRFIRDGLSPDQVRDRVLRIIDDPSPAFRYPVGSQATWLPRVKAFLPWATFASSMAKRFGQTDVRAPRARA
jgi:short-subunit dehydrogenase